MVHSADAGAWRNQRLAGDVHFCCGAMRMTCQMETPSTTNSDPSLEAPGHQTAVLQMKEVLSLRLPSLYRCALGLLGNAADAEDAAHEALLALTGISTNSEDSR
jgi:hypothetical protein